MSRYPCEQGGVLLIALVLLSVIVVFLGAAGSLIATQRHALAQQVRSAQAFQIADAGFNYFLSLLENPACTPKQLNNQTIRRLLIDPVTQEAVGTYTLTFSLANNTLQATSVGEPASSHQCQGVLGTLVSEKKKYTVTWRPLGTVECAPSTDLAEPPC